MKLSYRYRVFIDGDKVTYTCDRETILPKQRFAATACHGIICGSLYSETPVENYKEVLQENLREWAQSIDERLEELE